MGEVRQLFSQLQVRREPGGKVVIEAPAEAASTLERLLRRHGRLASGSIATRELTDDRPASVTNHCLVDSYDVSIRSEPEFRADRARVRVPAMAPVACETIR